MCTGFPYCSNRTLLIAAFRWCVPCDVAAVVCEVGPGRPFVAVSSVPWESLLLGDVVRIHWCDQPYREKWVICRQGTSTAPITVSGVPDPAAGSLPVIDASGAVSRPQLNFWNENRALIKIGGANNPPDTEPRHLVVENLELSGARPPHLFQVRTRTASHVNNPAAVFIAKGAGIILRNGALHDSGNGLFVSRQSSTSSSSPTIFTTTAMPAASTNTTATPKRRVSCFSTTATARSVKDVPATTSRTAPRDWWSDTTGSRAATAATGGYHFTGVPVGTYQVCGLPRAFLVGLSGPGSLQPAPAWTYSWLPGCYTVSVTTADVAGLDFIVTAVPVRPQGMPGTVQIIAGDAGYYRPAGYARCVIRFVTDGDGEVAVRILTLRVALIDEVFCPATAGGVLWSRTDRDGRSVASGVYLVRVTGSGLNATHLFAVLRESRQGINLLKPVIQSL